jgi:hypothetical protein
MERYEYRTVEVDSTTLASPRFVEELNALGADGWRLTATIPHERHGYSRAVHLIFSRITATG